MRSSTEEQMQHPCTLVRLETCNNRGMDRNTLMQELEQARQSRHLVTIDYLVGTSLPKVQVIALNDEDETTIIHVRKWIVNDDGSMKAIDRGLGKVGDEGIDLSEIKSITAWPYLIAFPEVE
jgi:hypothetical protein